MNQQIKFALIRVGVMLMLFTIIIIDDSTPIIGNEPMLSKFGIMTKGHLPKEGERIYSNFGAILNTRDYILQVPYQNKLDNLSRPTNIQVGLCQGRGEGYKIVNVTINKNYSLSPIYAYKSKSYDRLEVQTEINDFIEIENIFETHCNYDIYEKDAKLNNSGYFELMSLFI